MLVDRQCCRDRPPGIVVLGAREAEQRHHSVAHELVREAAVRLDDLPDRVLDLVTTSATSSGSRSSVSAT
jgi:hypothetical protein